VWRPAVRLVIACSGGTGADRQALRPAPRGARCTRCGGNAADGSADPEPKNRHGGAPRGERPTSLGARRLASAWHAASSHAQRMRSAASVRLSALRPPLNGGNLFHHPGATAPWERVGLGCLTSEDVSQPVVSPRAALLRNAPSTLAGEGSNGLRANSNGRGAASKDLLAKNPPPVRFRISTELPSPARGEGAGGTLAPEAPSLRRRRASIATARARTPCRRRRPGSATVRPAGEARVQSCGRRSRCRLAACAAW
jgi:hypothetical protein